MPEYKIGDRVDRIEDRETTGATIISIQNLTDDIVVELQYDEGGTGWWPVSAIKPINT
jgi:hypothetical protein